MNSPEPRSDLTQDSKIHILLLTTLVRAPISDHFMPLQNHMEKLESHGKEKRNTLFPCWQKVSRDSRVSHSPTGDEHHYFYCPRTDFINRQLLEEGKERRRSL